MGDLGREVEHAAGIVARAVGKAAVRHGGIHQKKMTCLQRIGLIVDEDTAAVGEGEENFNITVEVRLCHLPDLAAAAVGVKGKVHGDHSFAAIVAQVCKIRKSFAISTIEVTEIAKYTEGEETKGVCKMDNKRIIPYSALYEAYLRDESRTVGKADSISFPACEEEVREVLRALPTHVPVTVQGARTGLAAAAVPQEV